MAKHGHPWIERRTHGIRTRTHRPGREPSTAFELVALVDALVEAIDIDRTDAVERVWSALAPFGGSGLFASELRLNGRSSEQVWALLAAEYGVEVLF